LQAGQPSPRSKRPPQPTYKHRLGVHQLKQLIRCKVHQTVPVCAAAAAAAAAATAPLAPPAPAAAAALEGGGLA